ncbi:MAG TPA: PAS domain S-box protein [Candidatus Acidoferrales bacterium]|nr:PAS domain S-box protein [Candidatus Acidoferrales bacterium]
MRSESAKSKNTRKKHSPGKVQATHKPVEELFELQVAALGVAANPVVITDRTGTILWVNPAFEALTGYTRQEAVGQSTRLLKSDGNPPALYKQMWETILAGQKWRGELVNRRKDGSLYDEEMTITPVRTGGAGVTHFIGIKLDITERKRAEEILRRQASLFDQTYDAVLVWDWEGSLTFWNRAAERLYGFSREEALGKSSQKLLGTRTEGDRGVILAALERDSRWEGEIEQVTRDGRRIRLESRMTLVRASGSAYVLEVNRDISERHLLEEQFRQSQKMEAVGRLAGGIAHDFNNILGVILGYSDVLLARPELHEQLQNKVDEIRKAGLRAASLTRQLLAFSRQQVLEPRVVDPNAIVADLSKMLRRLIGDDIKLITIAAPAVGRVRIDPGQIEQVLMNLAVNSRDAMPQGGVLTIETADVVLDREYVRQHPVAVSGSYVMLAVSDTGAGMDAETQRHIFEPFYTTKGAVKGTGLGLATVYGIVKQSGGYIWVYSEVGKGTTFKIYLPRVEEKAAPVKLSEFEPQSLRGTETILLVEDAESLRNVVRESLESHGYAVLAAANADEALRVAASYQGPLHLLLTDVIMPGRHGRALAEALAPLHPETRVLYMSGYTDDAIVHHGVLESGTAFLQKPFTLNALGSKVRAVLSSTRVVP